MKYNAIRRFIRNEISLRPERERDPFLSSVRFHEKVSFHLLFVPPYDTLPYIIIIIRDVSLCRG